MFIVWAQGALKLVVLVRGRLWRSAIAVEQMERIYLWDVFHKAVPLHWQKLFFYLPPCRITQLGGMGDRKETLRGLWLGISSCGRMGIFIFAKS